MDRLILGYKPYVVSVIFFDEPKTIYYYSSTGDSIRNNTIDYHSSMGGTASGVKHQE
ncbi:hypothetical protein [Clostridium sp. JS66]|uniref:hypothetical protein n=1 Tax=Clostridium sp. JS66 TaxID=3064705 RepID=UPI00298DC15A|nr:hypothetical protein [Clostridium sp. JS66]WPC39885.1 hypothetical protein Q6H37_18455 [Clostridium sp. JS66]WPC41145.1 hypothetical protein Q6H37_25135 [Clostridium sp. JS66]